MTCVECTSSNTRLERRERGHAKVCDDCGYVGGPYKSGEPNYRDGKATNDLIDQESDDSVSETEDSTWDDW